MRLLEEAIAGAGLTLKAKSTFAQEIKDLKEKGDYHCTVPTEEWEAIIYEVGGICCKVVGGTEHSGQEDLSMADVFRMDPDPYHAKRLNAERLTRPEAQQIAVHELWSVICKSVQPDEPQPAASNALAVAS